jgi:hypothetical protein
MDQEQYILRLGLHIEDRWLLDRTAALYAEAVERGEMTEQQAEEDWLALFSGMTTIVDSDSGEVLGRLNVR